MVSQNSLLFPENECHSSSEDSLEKSFKDTELASDDEEAEQQIAAARAERTLKEPNAEALNLLSYSQEEHK